MKSVRGLRRKQSRWVRSAGPGYPRRSRALRGGRP